MSAQLSSEIPAHLLAAVTQLTRTGNADVHLVLGVLGAGTRTDAIRALEVQEEDRRSEGWREAFDRLNAIRSPEFAGELAREVGA